MADPNSLAGFPPGVDPTEWLQTQRQMALAQQLQSMAMSPAQADLQQPAGGGKYYQAARVRPITALSKLAEALMARRGMDQALPKMANQYSQAVGAFAPGGQIVPTGQSAVTSGPQGAPEGPVPAPRTPTYIQTPSNPLNPGGLPATAAMRLYQNPEAYSKYLLGPEPVQLGRIAGLDPQSAAGAAFNKQNAMELRSGGMIRLPNGQILRAPNLPPGYEPEFDGQGNLIGTHPAPGLIQGEAQREGAVTGAKEANIPREVDMGGGVKALRYPGDIPAVGQPPALRAPPSNAPGAPQYFKSPPPSGSMPSAPPAGSTAPQADWLKNAPKINIPNTPGQSTDAYHQKILDKAAEKHIELADKYGSEADLADQRIAFNKEALKVLQGAETGPLSDQITHLSAKAQELGIQLPWLPDQKTVENTQELKKFLLRNPLLSLKPTFGGRPAASEFQVLANEASPSPAMLKSTIQRLVELDTQQAGYVKQRATDYGLYQQHGGDPTRFESYYSNTHPFAKALDSKAPTAGPKTVKSDADYNALASGEEFIDPEGKHRRKP
jgi:hypothetical protein